MAHTILLADDDTDILSLCSLYLKDLGRIITAKDGNEALNAFKRNVISLAVIDIMMPGINGFQLMNEIRRLDKSVPILVITAKTLLEDKTLGFQSGADDYLCKPFDPEELLLRAKALLRRAYRQTEYRGMIVSDGVRFDPASCTITNGDSVTELTATETRLLEALIQGGGRVLTLEQLYEAGWGESFPVNDNAIRVCVNKLRNKVGENKIKTIRGIGYKWDGTQKT